jgi:hypothetical protein
MPRGHGVRATYGLTWPTTSPPVGSRDHTGGSDHPDCIAAYRHVRSGEDTGRLWNSGFWTHWAGISRRNSTFETASMGPRRVQ